MFLLFSHGSGMVIITASGRSMPFITMNSSALSSMAESEPEVLMMGRILFISSCRMGLEMLSSRASMASVLPLMVLISPLCRMKRLGCARIQLGLVLVEKRLCTMPMADS